MASKVVPVRMSEAELAAVDRVRGDVPLSTWLKRLAADAVAAQDGLSPAVSRPERVRRAREVVAGEGTPLPKIAPRPRAWGAGSS